MYHEFCSFLTRLTTVKDRKQKLADGESWNDNEFVQTVRKWLRTRTENPVKLFLLISPQDDIDRRYGFGPPVILAAFDKAFHLGDHVKRNLDKWKSKWNGDLATCIQETLKKDLCHRKPSNLTIDEVHQALDELAMGCNMSNRTFLKSRSDLSHCRKRPTILQYLFEAMSLEELTWTTRILLRSMHPYEFYLPKVLFAYDPRLCEMYKHQKHVDTCFLNYKKDILPAVTVAPVGIKSSFKLNKLEIKESPFAVEIKYDGERMQIHWDGNQRVIFSKHLRNSTKERSGCLGIFKQSLKPHVTSCIIEAELLACDTETGEIKSFTELRKIQYANKDGGLCDGPYFIVFFDVLYVNGQYLVDKTYRERRKILEDIILPVPKRTKIVESKVFTVMDDIFKYYYAGLLAKGHEGVIIKPLDSTYHTGEWYKLKEDYIAGLYDSAEFLVVGVSYGKLEDFRADKFGQPLYSTFHLAAMTNRQNFKLSPTKCKPVLRIFQTMKCFGLKTEDLTLLNEQLQPLLSGTDPEWEKMDWLLDSDSYKNRDLEHYLSMPIVLELYGSDHGIVPHPKAGSYYLKFPRVKRVRYDVDWFSDDPLTWQHIVNLGNAARSDDRQQLTNSIMQRLNHLKGTSTQNTEKNVMIFQETRRRLQERDVVEITQPNKRGKFDKKEDCELAKVIHSIAKRHNIDRQREGAKVFNLSDLKKCRFLFDPINEENDNVMTLLEEMGVNLQKQYLSSQLALVKNDWKYSWLVVGSIERMEKWQYELMERYKPHEYEKINIVHSALIQSFYRIHQYRKTSIQVLEDERAAFEVSCKYFVFTGA